MTQIEFNDFCFGQRDGEYKYSRGPTFGDFVAILRDGSMQDITFPRLHITRIQYPPPPPIKRNVLRESLSEDS